MILWIFAIAYGRMTDELGWKPFAILAAISAVVSYVVPSGYMPNFALEFVGNMGGFIGLFFLGFAFGRWRARREQDGY